MATILMKRIEAKNGGSNGSHIRDVVQYITDRFDELDNGKCVATHAENFSTPNPDNEQAIDEMNADCALSKRLEEGQGIDHWVMSWKTLSGETLSPDETFTAMKQWLVEMGYEKHKWFAAFHHNTENPHVHIAICRVNPLTGKVKPRGWYKNDSQRALVTIADTLGYSLPKGHKFKRSGKTEKTRIMDEITKQETITEKPKTEESGERGEFYPGEKAARIEKSTGQPSIIRILHEKLTQTHEQIRDNLESMKWGQIHKLLASQGIQMELVEKNGQQTLVYSLDNKIFVGAKKTCPEMSWKNLSEKIGAKTGWRKRNREVEEILQQAREEIQANQKKEEKPKAKKKKEAKKPKPETREPEEDKGQIPEYLLSTALEERLNQETAGRTPVQTDAESAKTLYQAGATENEVYQYIRFYGASCLHIKQRPANRFARKIAKLHKPEKLDTYKRPARKNPKARELWRKMAPEYQKFYIRQAQKRRRKLLEEKRAQEIMQARLKEEAYWQGLERIQNYETGEEENGTTLQTTGTRANLQENPELIQDTQPQQRNGDQGRSEGINQERMESHQRRRRSKL